MKESVLKIVSLNDTDPEAMEVFLKFIYSGTVSILGHIMMDIVDLSEKYGLSDLKNICQLEMKRNIKIETAVITLILADQYNMIETKKHVLAFIKGNLQDVRKTEAWKSSMKQHVDLMEDIFDQIL